MIPPPGFFIKVLRYQRVPDPSWLRLRNRVTNTPLLISAKLRRRRGPSSLMSWRWQACFQPTAAKAIPARPSKPSVAAKPAGSRMARTSVRPHRATPSSKMARSASRPKLRAASAEAEELLDTVKFRVLIKGLTAY